VRMHTEALLACTQVVPRQSTNQLPRVSHHSTPLYSTMQAANRVLRFVQRPTGVFHM